MPRIDPDPRLIADEVQALLRAEANPKAALAAQRFFREPVRLFGISAAVLRRHARAIGRRVHPTWTVREAVRLCDHLIQEPHLEAKAIGLLVLSIFRDDLPASALPRVKRWLARWCGNWATVDLLAPEGYGEMIGGGERIHDLTLLREKIREHDLPEKAFTWYCDIRRYGSVPHSGFGLGLERTVGYICGLKHLREAIPFPRLLNRLNP